MTVHTLEVGKPYVLGRVSWPAGVATFDVRHRRPELVVFVSEPAAGEIEDYRHGTPHFGILVEGPVILVVFRFGNQPVRDAPFSCHLTRAEERGIPECLPGHRLAVQALVVDAATGFLKVIRQVTLASETSQELIEAMRQQAAAPFKQAVYDHALAAAYQHGTGAALARRVVMRPGG
jgi:hypothetical protein